MVAKLEKTFRTTPQTTNYLFSHTHYEQYKTINQKQQNHLRTDSSRSSSHIYREVCVGGGEGGVRGVNMFYWPNLHTKFAVVKIQMSD